MPFIKQNKNLTNSNTGKVENLKFYHTNEECFIVIQQGSSINLENVNKKLDIYRM